MHHYRPDPPFFAGDPMPFFHEGVFNLFYLLDENHHQGLGGLGGHQWAHATTTDLIHWQHHPLAVAIDAPWEGSNCTGSTFWHEGVFYAFYATRKRDWTQHLCVATSQDGIHFTKDPGGPFLSAPPGYSPTDLRDPFVCADGEGGFLLLATSKLDPFPLEGRGGCLLLLHSRDLAQWTVEGPWMVPGGGAGYLSVPECPDLFAWNGRYYLLYSQGLQTRYRMARSLRGPWLKPAVDLLDSPLAAVMKTAPFGADRRIGVAFTGTRQGDRDEAPVQWAGNLVFRELVQRADGTLGTRFVPEMALPASGPLRLTLNPLTPGVSGTARSARLEAPQSLEVAALDGAPVDFHLTCRVSPGAGSPRLGLGLRGEGPFGAHYAMIFEPALRRVSLADQSILEVGAIQSPFHLEVVFNGDLVEACVAGERCIINRLPELKGERLFLFCESGEVSFDSIEVRALNPV